MTDSGFKINVSITEQDLIAPYNHVHHAQILHFVERARTEWIASLGFPMEYWFSVGIFPVVRAMSIEYLREVKLGEHQISCHCLELARRNLFIHQEILNDQGKVLVTAEVNLMFIDVKTGRGAVLDQALSSRIAPTV